MSDYTVLCPNCRHVLFSGPRPSVPDDPSASVRLCGRCGEPYLNTWALDEPALLDYDEYTRAASVNQQDELDAHLRWKESDKRLRDLDYALSLRLAGHDVPARYFPKGFRLITEASQDRDSLYSLMGAYACDRTDALEGRYEQRVRELNPNLTGLSSKKTRAAILLAREAF